jgi:hypothetical protein
VTFENCWSFYNGYSTAFVSLGDGNGFKAGGYGQAPVVASLPNPIPSHTVRFCMAYRNKANGFYANHHVVTGGNWYNNSAFRNSTNYNMLSQRITTSSKTGADTTLDCPGINHVLHNNFSYKYSILRDTLNIGTSNITYNSFTPLTTIVVDASDFVSVDESLLVAPRQADGSLPDNGFLRLTASSDLIDKGIDLGFPFNGLAPDLGAFEFKNSQTINFDSIPAKKNTDASFQPNALATSGLPVTFTSSNFAVAVINGSSVIIKGVGTAIITASQFGNINYYAAPEIKRTLIVQSDQIITFNPIPQKNYGDSTFILNATSSSNLPITYTSSNLSVATISGNVVTIVGAGKTTITASQAGNANYLPATSTQTLTVNNSSTSNIENTRIDISNISVSPNPSGGSVELKFSLNTPSPVKIEVIDYKGIVVYKVEQGILKNGEITQTLDLAALAKGVYIISIQTIDGFQTINFIRL